MRDMTNLNQTQAEKSGWNMLVPFVPDCEVIGKAVYEGLNVAGDTLRIMKSTKRFKVNGGWIYNTSTEMHSGAQISVAEALVFVPEVK